MIIEKIRKLEFESERRGIPIVGSEKGRWLYDKLLVLNPKYILELGTANGYSGIILGSLGGRLISIEINPEIAEEAKINFNNFNINAEIIVGDAVEEVRKLALKKEYQEFFYLIFIYFDNITFEGSQDYKKAVLNHPRLKTEIINVKDGLSCSQKIN